MHAADDFLRAIDAEPGDRTRRLVFADWLDERADPRGELIRVEEEMRTLPVFSDRFWELKPRRNELRDVAGPEWCGRMRYGTECEPVFRHGIPDGWRERWRLIREFTERWHRVPMPDVGGRQKEIAEAEARLGRTLPPSVREWVAFAHDARRVPGIVEDSADFARDWIAPPVIYLGFNPDAEGGWVVRHEDLAQPDPPVRYCGYYDDDSGEGAWVVAPASSATQPVTGWAFDMLIPNVALRPQAVSFVVRDAARLLPELERHLSPRVRVGATTLVEADNVVIHTPTLGGEAPWATCARPLNAAEVPAVLRQILRPENETLPF